MAAGPGGGFGGRFAAARTTDRTAGGTTSSGPPLPVMHSVLVHAPDKPGQRIASGQAPTADFSASTRLVRSQVKPWASVRPKCP